MVEWTLKLAMDSSSVQQPHCLLQSSRLSCHQKLIGGKFFFVVLPKSTHTVDRKLVGVAMFPVAISSLVGSPIGGQIIGINFEWWKGIVWTGVLIGTAATIQILALYIHRKNI